MIHRGQRHIIDDFGQVDGDDSVAFQPGSAGAPWLRGGLTPWHMWGNSQVIRANATTSDEFVNQVSGQLVKISYKRPETWHFLLSARMTNVAPLVSPTNDAAMTVVFDVITGVGRTQVQMPNLETFNWKWLGSDTPPVSKVLWTQQAQTPALRMILVEGEFVDDPASVRVFNELIGEDIQVNCRVAYYMRGIDEGDQTFADVEVSAFLAPKTHIRPDWFIKGPAELMFPGSEIQGR